MCSFEHGWPSTCRSTGMKLAVAVMNTDELPVIKASRVGHWVRWRRE